MTTWRDDPQQYNERMDRLTAMVDRMDDAELNTGNIDLLIDHLKNVEEKAFNMADWMKGHMPVKAGKNAEHNVCGTSACLAGYCTVIVLDNDLELEESYTNTYSGYVCTEYKYAGDIYVSTGHFEGQPKTTTSINKSTDFYHVGRVFLGLTEEQARQLFMPTPESYPDRVYSSEYASQWRESITRNWAIRCLEKLRDTCVIDWHGTK